MSEEAASDRSALQLGLNITPERWVGPARVAGMNPSRFSRYLAARMDEIGVASVRVPILWHKLADFTSGTQQLDPSAVDGLAATLGRLPEGVGVLAALTSPPVEVAAEYFEDRTTLGPHIARFLELIVDALPQLNSWDIWNEPNASDFYLSVRTHDGHRPWTGAEFVQDVVRPAHDALARALPAPEICAVSFAENGLVGHDDRPAPIANRLLADPRFAELRSPDPHGQFYFIPDFARSVLAELSPQEAPIVGVHPYPYFRIWQDRDPDLIGRSRKLMDNFMGLAELGDRDVWITEVGARSFDVLQRNRRDEKQQADYVEAMTELCDSLGVDRLYLYKLVDGVPDLRMEKSFGLLDHAGRPREVFGRLQRRAATLDVPGAAARMGGGFDSPARAVEHTGVWRVEQTSEFGFVTPDRDGGVLVSPGRNEGDSFVIAPVRPIATTHGLQMDLGIEPFGGWRSVEVQFHLGAATSTSVSTVHLHAGDELALTIGDEEHRLPPVVAPELSPPELRRISLLLEDGHLSVEVASRRASASLTRRVDLSLPEIVSPSVSIVAGPRPPGAVSLTELNVIGDGSGDLYRRGRELCHPTDDLDTDWTLDISTRAQLDQETWVGWVYGLSEPGFFIEIGAGDGLNNSNSSMLERRFGWSGLLIEANPARFRASTTNRNCVVIHAAVSDGPSRMVEMVDAGDLSGIVETLQDDVHAARRSELIAQGRTVEVRTDPGDALFERYDAPDLINYLSVDTEGNELEVLQSIDLGRWKVGLVSVEHAGVADKRERVAELLGGHGFERHPMWFEDWYAHPANVGEILGIDEQEARVRVDEAIARLPLDRMRRLMEAGRSRRAQGDHPSAALEFTEGTRRVYPNNAQLFAEAIRSWRESGEYDRAMQIVEAGRRQYPNHTGIVRQGALVRATVSDRDGFTELIGVLIALGVDVGDDAELRDAGAQLGVGVADVTASGG